MKQQPLSAIKYLTIHCSATPEGRENTAAEVTSWDIDRFGQPSYHHVIEIDGASHRTLPDTTVGANVGGHNTGNIGICYVGGMTRDMKAPKDTRTPAQRRELERLVAAYRKAYPGIVVRGHREWPGVSKACPSFDVASEIKRGLL